MPGKMRVISVTALEGRVCPEDEDGYETKSFSVGEVNALYARYCSCMSFSSSVFPREISYFSSKALSLSSKSEKPLSVRGNVPSERPKTKVTFRLFNGTESMLPAVTSFTAVGIMPISFSSTTAKSSSLNSCSDTVSLPATETSSSRAFIIRS